MIQIVSLRLGRSYGKSSWPSDGTEDWAGDYIYCNGWDLASSADPERRINYPVCPHQIFAAVPSLLNSDLVVATRTVVSEYDVRMYGSQGGSENSYFLVRSVL